MSVSGYYVAGPGEQVDMKAAVKGWNTASVSTEGWLEPVHGPAGEPKDYNSPNQGEGHNLRPSTLPQMELTPQNLASVRKAEGVRVPAGFLEGKAALTVPANTKAELLLDQGFLTNAYFNLAFSGGRDARLTVGYAEALFVPAPAREMSEEELARIPAEFRRMARMPRTAGKGNRNDVEGKIFQGREDVLISDGSRGQSFTTLSWRTYRYVRLQVETAGEPLTIDRLDGTFTGYPFTLDARLDTDDAELQKMLEIGWRTARLCAVETYMDCPYYEQLQYLGDTRIQALVTLYNSADDRMVRNFLYLADISRSVDGITKSRYPTNSSYMRSKT